MTRSVLGPYAGLRWHFFVECDSDVLSAEVGRTLAPLACSDTSGSSSYVIEAPSQGSEGRLLLDGRLLYKTRKEALLFARLLWHINLSTVSASQEYVLLHAAAAERHGRAVVLSAPMEAGKTTLVAGLVRAGLGYLTDETTAVDPSSGFIVPYPKALSIDPGSWTVLADLKPAVQSGAEHLAAAQWQVPAADIRDGAVSTTRSRPRVIVVPRYVAGARTSLESLTPGEALLAVLQQTFNLDRNRARDMHALAGVLEHCACYRLTSGQLSEAVDALLEVLPS